MAGSLIKSADGTGPRNRGLFQMTHSHVEQLAQDLTLKAEHGTPADLMQVHDQLLKEWN